MWKKICRSTVCVSLVLALSRVNSLNVLIQTWQMAPLLKSGCPGVILVSWSKWLYGCSEEKTFKSLVKKSIVEAIMQFHWKLYLMQIFLIFIISRAILKFYRRWKCYLFPWKLKYVCTRATPGSSLVKDMDLPTYWLNLVFLLSTI